ncbi:hypothetical protein GOODEAATRI_010676, partial [Goodea atripinnis]
LLWSGSGQFLVEAGTEELVGMSSFSESALEKKLTELSSSQQSVQTLSLWIIHHRKHSGLIVKVWHRELKKGFVVFSSIKLLTELKRTSPSAFFSHLRCPSSMGMNQAINRLLHHVYCDVFYFTRVLQEVDVQIVSPLSTEELVKALQDLENAASGDAAVRQKIASLPQEVQDVSLLEKITDKEAADKLSKTVDEACLLLAEYNGRLAAELEDRRQLARMLTEYISSQKEALVEREKKLEEYKQKLARVTRVRKELKSHIQSLPDLSLLPNVTGGLAPLPSAGDLFSTD